MPKKWTWDQMIEEFRALGGVADNVIQKKGEYGRGLFPIDPSKPVTVRASENLLFDIEKMTFDNGALRIKKDAAGIGEREKKFFDMFENDFSWGLSGRSDCAAFLKGMEQLPESLRNLLISDFGQQKLFAGSGEEKVKNRFMLSRMIRKDGKRLLMPVVELVNHGVKGSPFQFKDGIAVKGTFSGEVLAHYGLTDPFGVFCTWGFACEEPAAFSLPIRLPLKPRRLIIRRDIQDKKILGYARAPTVKVEKDTIVLSYLMLGHAKFPRMAKGIFYRLMKDQNIERPDAEEIFDRILFFNRMSFLKLRAASDDLEGPMIPVLRNTAQYQLKALMHNIGVRTV